MKKQDLKIIKKIIWLRLVQFLVNSRYQNGDFLVPIHLALGHESIAVAVDAAMKEKDAIFLTHRNIHYNLVRMGTLKEALDEYYLRETGMAEGRLGSMNLSNPDKNIIYSSSILGNNLGVGCGYALGNKTKRLDGVVFIVTGDGAIEEGSFYESLLFLKSNNLPVIIIVENNEWSLGTKIHERRANIDLNKLADSLDIEYFSLQGNDPFEYKNELNVARHCALKNSSPILVEVNLTTLGYWYLKDKDFPDGRFINYHAGPVTNLEEKEYPMLASSNEDPLYKLIDYLSMDDLIDISKELREDLKVEKL